MGASWIGKVSHNKRRQAMNPSLLIAVVTIDVVIIKRRQSARDTNTSNATRNKAMAWCRRVALPTNATRVLWGRREYHDKTHFTTTIIVAVASLPQLLCVKINRRPFLDRKPWADRANSCPWSHTMRASGSTKKANTSSKNKHSHHDTWNVHHARNTCSMNSASESTGSVRDTIPRQ